MVILENILILSLFGGALGYVIKLITKPFFKNEGAGGSCSSCEGGCSSIPKFENLPEIKQH